ncbi:MAG: CoA-binding protein [Calditrichaeota bacterium]|nr:CoA-binding protein [Calditrichota bacterium]
MKKLNENIGHIIKNHKRIAVVGLSDKPYRSSFGIALLMQQAGYQIIPVNPNVDEVLGEKSYPSLLDIPGDIDLVDVFRRAEEVDAVVDQAIQKGAKALWMQSGIINHTAAQKALEAGMDVVMDRCWGVEYRMNPAVVNA